jgi:hypothetical protein
MGCDADAFLYYGFNFADDDKYDEEKPSWLEDQRGDKEVFYASKHGVVDDSGLFTKEGGYAVRQGQPGHAEADKKWHAWLDKKNELWKNAGADINFFGSDDGQTHFVYIKMIKADWSESTVVECLPEVTPAEIDKLKAFCEIMEIKWQEPAWHLAARWF